MLVSWRVWKERNVRVFNNVELNASQLTSAILSEGDLWIQAGAKKLLAIGWPCSALSQRILSS
jgi:hypothetical protein